MSCGKILLKQSGFIRFATHCMPPSPGTSAYCCTFQSQRQALLHDMEEERAYLQQVREAVQL